MLRKEAIAIAGIAWFVCGLHAALPHLLCNTDLSFAQSIFEAISGLTTTGSTVTVDLQEIPRSLLFWRSLTQWLGGLGIVMIFLLLQSKDGTSGKMMFGAESSLPISDLNFSNFSMDPLYWLNNNLRTWLLCIWNEFIPIHQPRTYHNCNGRIWN